MSEKVVDKDQELLKSRVVLAETDSSSESERVAVRTVAVGSSE